MRTTPPPVKLRSPFARAVVPVLGGIAVLVLIGLLLWGIAAYISGGGTETTERLAPTRLDVGSASNAARIVEEEGPILFPALGTTTGERTLVLDHEGDDPTRGWRLYFAFPAGGDPDCTVEQIVGTRTFTDCNGNELDVTELAPPSPGVNPVVEDQRRLVLDLRGLSTGT